MMSPTGSAIAASSRPLPYDVAGGDASGCVRSATSPKLATGQWTVSWLWHISTNVAMRAARVWGFFASWTR